MSAAAAFREGIRRVNGAPMVAGRHVRRHAAGVAAAVVRASRDDRRAPRTRAWPQIPPRPGTNYEWWREFSAQATGLGTTFVPSITGFGAVLDNLSGLLDRTPSGGNDCRRHRCMDGALVVSDRRHHRSARARATHAIARVLCRVRDAFLAAAAAGRRSP